MSTLTDFNVDSAGALDTAEAVRRGEISALEVCNAAIARIEARDKEINAVVVRDFDRAIAAAKDIDATRTADDSRPLLGVAMTVKESNNVAGLPSTWGMEVFRDFRPEADGPPVARLKAAGAVILGKTNAPVALADWQSVNPIYGRTVNPYDHTRSPGGSSGGAAAALATRMVPLELGSDIGGSIRIPCHMCGVFGHKPTYGVVPLKGHDFPGTDGVEIPLAVVGPMARHAKDVAAALDVVAGPWRKGWKLDLSPARQNQLQDFRVLVIDTFPNAGADEAVTGPIHALAKTLEALGADVQYRNDALPDLGASHVTYVQYLMNILSRGTPDAHPVNAHQMMDFEDAQLALQRHWEQVFRDVDIILAPAFGTPAFPHDDRPDWADRTLTIGNEATPYAAQLSWAGLATFPGLPSTAAPLGLTSAGLPTGVQIIGDLFDDRTTLMFAELLEREGLAASPMPSL